MRRSTYFFSLVAFLFNALLLLPVAAQEGRGSITGTVKDSQNGALVGALVEIQPTGKRAVSDNQGQYKITDVAAGEYTLTVTYVGFAASNSTVRVDAGQTATLDPVLNVASQTDQVVVTAERLQGEAEAINVERTSDDIVQVLPLKVITSLPNTNVADAVGRAPSVTLERDEGEGKYVQIRGTEPRLNNLTINGVEVPSPEATVRQVKLDTVPADLVDRIEVYKTLSANQDPNAIGGSVNLVTRTAGERPTIEIATQGGYTPIQGGRPLYGFSGTVGQRFGETKKLGIIVGGTYDFNGRGIDDYEPGQAIQRAEPQTNGQNVAYVSTADERTYEYYRTRFGYSGGLDYTLSPGSNLYIKGFYGDFHDYGDVWVYTPNAGAITSVSGSQINFDATGNMVYRQYVRRPDQGAFSVSMGGRHDLSSTLINYEFAVSRAHNRGGQDFATTWFAGPTGIPFSLNLSNPFIPKFTAQDGTNLYDPTKYSILPSIPGVGDAISVPYYNTAQLNFQGSASLARRYTAGGHFGVFELGLLIRNEHKLQNENDQLYNATGSVNVSLDQVLGTYTNPSYYSNALQVGPLSDADKYNRLILPSLGTGFTLDSSTSNIKSFSADWDLNERVYAGYLMNSISFGKARLQTGVRFEATDTSYNALQVVLNSGAYDHHVPNNGSSNYLNILPSVQLQYQLGKNTDARASFDMGISRPNFQDQVPAVTSDPNATPKTVQLGNPSLKPTRANNYDVLVEHFFQPLGILQAGFFYKALTNPIYPTVTILPSSDPLYPNFQQTESINGPSAHIAGFEAAWEQRFSFLPGLLNGFGVAANYSWTTSRVTFPAGFSGGRIDHPTLQRQAPNTWNLGLTYDKARLSVRFAVSHNDANLFAYGYVHDPSNPQNDNDPILGIKGPLADQYLYAHTQYDIQGSYRMYKGLDLVVSGLNLSNEVFGFYTGSPIYPNQREFYKPTVIIGLRWSLRAD